MPETIEIPVESLIKIRETIDRYILQSEANAYVCNATARKMLGCSASHLSRLAAQYDLRDKSRKGHECYRVSELLKIKLGNDSHSKKIT